MLSCLLVLPASLAVAPSARAELPTEAPLQGWSLEADRIRKQGAILSAEGEVHLVWRGHRVRARRVELDPDRRRLEVLGAKLTSPGHGDLELEHAELTLSDEGLVIRRARLGAGRLSLCPCVPGLQVQIDWGEIDEGGAWLGSPVLRVEDWPLLWLPIARVPLGERRSGLLLPRAGLSRALGGWFRAPVYLAPAPSWDLTLEPGWATRRGAMLDMDARWVPAEDARGRMRIAGLLDLASRPSGGDLVPSEPRLRGAVAGHHRSAFGGGRLRAGMDLVSDADWRRRFEETFEARQVEWTRSAVTWTTTATRTDLGVALTFWQNLRPEGLTILGGDTDLRDFGSEGASGLFSERQRLLEVRADEASNPAFGAGLPVWASGSLQVGVHAGLEADDARFLRADLRRALVVELVSSSELGVSAELELVGRLTGWAGDEGALRVVPLGYLRAGWDRSFELLDAPVLLSARAGQLMAPAAWEAGSPSRFRTGDEVDRLGAAHQLYGRIDVEVLSKASLRPLLALRGRLATDLDVPGGRNGEGPVELVLEGEGRILLGPAAELRLEAQIALPPSDPLQPSLLFADLTAEVAEVGRLHAGYRQLGSTPPRWTHVGPEGFAPAPFVPLTLPATLEGRHREETRPWTAMQLFVFGASTSSPAGLRLGFEGRLDLGRRAREAGGALQSLSGFAGWVPPCDCFTAGVRGAYGRDRGGFWLGLTVELSRLDLAPSGSRIDLFPEPML